MLHELGAVREVRLDDYLALLAEEFSTGERRRRLETRLEPLTLDSKRAVSVGLIVNELVTNALRHAFPDNREGRILIGLATRPAEGQEGLEALVRVEDDGIGLSAAGKQPGEGGLGSAIVAALAEELRGSLSTDSSAGGTRIELAFRL
jgi:two-component sensor histidine kinase